MSEPSVASVRLIADAAASTSPSLSDESMRMSLPSLSLAAGVTPAPLGVAALDAAWIGRRLRQPRQQLAGARGVDDRDGAVDPRACGYSIKLHQQVESFAGVAVGGRKDRGMLG